MIYEGTCRFAGCGFQARVGSLDDCSAWLWQHECSCHPGLPRLAEVKSRCIFSDAAGCEPQGCPGTAYAAGFKPASKRAANENEFNRVAA